MLDINGFERWCVDLGLSETARRIVDQIRASSPARAVRSGHGNVRGRYPSAKMGCTIQFRNHTLELARIIELEHDPSVLEYYDQPSTMELTYHASSGRSVTLRHIPSFFILSAISAWWEDCKSDTRLQKLARNSPERYRLERGEWKCPPAEAFAAEAGLSYRVVSSTAIEWTYQRNLRFLSDYLGDSADSVSEEARNEVLSAIPKGLPTSLDNLLARTSRATADDVYRLVATGDIYVDLHAEALATPRHINVFRSVEAARAFLGVSPARMIGVRLACGERLSWDEQPWTVVNVGKRGISLLDASGRIVTLDHAVAEDQVTSGAIQSASKEQLLAPRDLHALPQGHPDELRVALDRLAVVDTYLSSGTCSGIARRTVQEWTARYRRAIATGRPGLDGLLPRTRHRGNRGRKLPEATVELMDEFVRTRFETGKRVSIRRVHEALIAECARRGVAPPSYKSMTEAVRRRSGPHQTMRREGRRAAYAETPFHWTLNATTPRHGDRPFEIVHADHTELDIELVDSQSGVNLGRPWATICTDAYSRRILSVVLVFDSPSYRSCMLALRELVERHNRFPESMVVDGGNEFESVYFETLLARYRCTKKSRPPGAPRFGSVCERLFGTTNSEIVHTLVGNTQIVRRPRIAVGKELPARQAVWSLPDLSQYLCTWAYEIYDARPHPALGQSPREAFEKAMERTGNRSGRIVPYDNDFRIASLPSTKKGTARIVAGRGFQIRRIYYWSVGDEFRSPGAIGKDVPVRYDPFDAGTAYAYFGARWIRCVSEHYSVFQGRSEMEVRLASAEIFGRGGIAHCRRRTEYIRSLTEFLESAQAEELLATQRMRDRETCRSRSQRTSPGGRNLPDDSSSTTRVRRPGERTRSRSRRSGEPLTEFEAY